MAFHNEFEFKGKKGVDNRKQPSLDHDERWFQSTFCENHRKWTASHSQTLVSHLWGQHLAYHDEDEFKDNRKRTIATSLCLIMIIAVVITASQN